MPMKNIGIIGSRRRDTFEDMELCLAAFMAYYNRKNNDRIISGGCKQGGDRFAEIFKKRYDIPIKIHYPDKSQLNKEMLAINPRRAYAEINYARNTLIAQDSDILICVVAPDRKGGTEDTIKTAKSLGKEIIIVGGEGVKAFTDEILFALSNYVRGCVIAKYRDLEVPQDEFDPYSI